MFDPQVPDEPPPPSYEVSQEVFDQKTQQGIQASLAPEDLWEEWDETKFEANAHAFIDGSASSSSSEPIPSTVTAQQYPKEKAPRPPSPPPPQPEEPAVRPLHIVKKSQAAKSQTAAYQKALEARSYQTNNPEGRGSSPDEGGSLSRSFSVLSVGRRTPPPMFELLGPSLDGPEYEAVVSYNPGSDRPSSPMSILSMDSYHPSALQPQPRLANPRPNTNMGTRPPPPHTQYQPPPRPTPAQAQRPSYQQPRRRVGFDPMSAYRSKSAFTSGLDPTPEKVDPSAFYKYVFTPPNTSYTSRVRLLIDYPQFRRFRSSLRRSFTFNNHPNVSDQRGISTVSFSLIVITSFCRKLRFVAGNFNIPGPITP